ncbi:type I-B CRISPR-associated protein Cas5 [Sesbania bispinosa]|nr:type I-B CRISPR-associated protein Cas5 [Sesbania bispinosa]
MANNNKLQKKYFNNKLQENKVNSNTGSLENICTCHAYIPKNTIVSADQITAKDFQKNGMTTLSNGMRRKR